MYYAPSAPLPCLPGGCWALFAPSFEHINATQPYGHPRHRAQHVLNTFHKPSAHFLSTVPHSPKMAMQNTLALPELLKNIISHLPERDILCNAQQVSCNWRSIIGTSPTVWKKIWSQIVEQPAITPVRYDEDMTQVHYGTPIYSRTTLMNPLLISQDEPSNHWLQLSKDLAIRMTAMYPYDHPPDRFLHSNLRMACPKLFEQLKAEKAAATPCEPTWRRMYLSQPPVTTVMLRIAYCYYEEEPTFKVMIRDKAGVTLGLVYDTFAATIPAYDESLEVPDEMCGTITAHVGWFETDEDYIESEDSEDDDSEEDGSEAYSSEYHGSGHEDSVNSDSDGSDTEDTGSDSYEYAQHESELGSEGGFEVLNDEELVKSNPQRMESSQEL